MKNRVLFPTLLTVAFTSGVVHAGSNFVLSGSDAAGAASFNAGTNWAAGTPTGAANQAPASGNTYQTGAFRIRTASSASNQTFLGDSLEIQAGGNMRNKTAATVTVNNLILANTAIVELTQPSGANGAGSIGTLEGNISLTGGTAVFMAGNSTDSPLHAFTISSTISGSGGLTTGNPALTVAAGVLAQSNGKVILTGDNSYNGNTAATSGTLLVNNITGSGTGSGTVTVGTNGTLGGTGSISGATTVGGKLAPGVNVGKLTFTGGLTLGNLAANFLKFELGAPTVAGVDYDTVETSALEIGTLDFTDFQFTNTGTLAPGTYTLFSSTAAITGSIGAATGTVGGFPATLSISGGNTLILTVSSILDTTAPSWVATYPKVGSISSSGFSALAKTDETGTAYFLVLGDGDPAPTSETVKSTGTAITLTANSEGSSAVAGLTPSTSYDVYFVAQDSVPNLQASPVKVDVTLDAFQSANFVLSGSDVPTTSSFNAGTNWGAGTPVGAANQAPVAGNTYQTGAFRIRTPQAVGNFTFAGDSLEIQAGGNMRNKTVGTVTINNFVLADTAIVELSQPNGQTAAGLTFGSLNGSISLASGAATFMAGNAADGVNHVFTIDSTISGVGGLNTTGSNGTVVLTANNTYTGATQVTSGTLSLVGGSQTSPITVSSGAKLGFVVDSPTTSSSSVTFSGATPKVTVTGTPAAVILMTAAGFTGTPVLDPAIPGFALQVTPTELKLVVASGNPYDAWAALFTPADVLDPAGDNDNDGLVNQQEFAFGLDPTTGSSVDPILVQLDKTTGTFTYQRRAGTGLTYRILKSTTLATGSWTEDAGAGQVATPSGQNEYVVVTLSGAPLTADKLFVRVAAQ